MVHYAVRLPLARLVLLSLLVLTMAFASACAPAAAPAAEPSAGEAAADARSDDAAITLVHWQHHFESRSKIVEELAAEFEASHPGVKIDFQSIPYNDYFQKIGPSLEAGTGPDVFQIPGSLVREFNDRGQLLPVPESVYSAADIEADFMPWTVQLLKQNGQYVGLPTDVQSFLLFYNDALFREAGLDPTKDFESWDELVAAADKLTKFDGDQMTQAGANIVHSAYQWYWWMLATITDDGLVDDAGNVTWNTPEGIERWTMLTDLVTKQNVDDPEFLTGQNKFLLGSSGMDMHEYTYAGNLDNSAPDVEYSIHMPPPIQGQPQETVGTHWAYVVSNQSEHPDLTWEWIKFLTSEDAQKRWIAGGGELPSLKALYDDPTLRENLVAAAGMDSMDKTVPFDDYGWDDVYNIQQAVWDNVVVGGANVASAVEEAAAASVQLYKDKGLIQ